MDPRLIYKTLKNQIVHLGLAPESVLNLSEMAESFGVSRTPIKEVLIYLQAEGWVMRQGSHFIVTPLSLERIREISEIRMVMEVQANIWAMQRITAAELAELEEMKEHILSVTGAIDNKMIVDLDFKVHRLLFKAAKNSQSRRLLERLLSHYLRFWLSIPRQIDSRSFFVETVALIEAVKGKDEDRIRECTRDHIRNSVAEIMGTG